MKLRLALIAWYILTAVSLYAEDWFQGAVVLKSNRVLKGEISIKFDHDVIVFRLANEVMVLPAHKVSSFYIYDQEEESNRQYISLPLEWGAATYHQFFELILNGDVKILRRQRVVWYSIHIDDIEYDYYIKKDNALTALSKFKREVFPALLQSSSDLSSYVREHKLRPIRLNDVVQIVDQYNQLQMNKNPIAKNQQ